MTSLPTGEAMNKDLSVRMSNCKHRAYIPHVLDLVRTGAIAPSKGITQVEDMPSVLQAYATFDQRQAGWTKAVIAP